MLVVFRILLVHCLELQKEKRNKVQDKNFLPFFFENFSEYTKKKVLPPNIRRQDFENFVAVRLETQQHDACCERIVLSKIVVSVNVKE